MHKPFFLAALIFSVVPMTPLRAAEIQPSDSQTPVSQIQGHTRSDLQSRWFAVALRLGAESFNERRSARREIEAAGAGASSALAGAVLQGNREAARVAYALLLSRLQSVSPELQTSSKSALRTIARAKHSIYSRRALALLEAEKEVERQMSLPLGELPDFLRGVDAITFEVRNGNQELRIDEAARRVTISRSSSGVLTIHVAATDGAAEKPLSVSVKNPAALRTSDPQMYALYRRYARLLSSRPALARGAGSEVATQKGDH